MFKRIVLGFLVLATSAVFGMSLNKLNTASKSELMEINGIGEVKADAIIKERRKGKFKSFEDFERVNGIGSALSDNVKHNKMGKSAGKRQDTKAHAKNASKKSKSKK